MEGWVEGQELVGARIVKDADRLSGGVQGVCELGIMGWGFGIMRGLWVMGRGVGVAGWRWR